MISVVLFILSGAVLLFIFVPKTIALRERARNPGKNNRGSNVRISGLDESATRLASSRATSRYSSFNRASSQGSTGSSSDPVSALLLQYQHLSWANKMKVKEKLSLSATHSITSLERFDARTEEKSGPEKDGADSGVEESTKTLDDEAPAEVVPESPARAEVQEQPPAAVDSSVP